MRKIIIAIPVLDELSYLEATIDSIYNQNYLNFQLYICVNQPDFWWDDERIEKCENNQKTLTWLREKYPDIKLIELGGQEKC